MLPQFTFAAIIAIGLSMQSASAETPYSIAQESGFVPRDATQQKVLDLRYAQEAALAKNLDRKHEVQAEMELAQQNVLVRAYIRDYLAAHPPTEHEVQQEYAMLRARRGDLEYRLRYFVTASEAQAHEVIRRLHESPPKDFEHLPADLADLLQPRGPAAWHSLIDTPPAIGEAVAGLGKGKAVDRAIHHGEQWVVVAVEDIRTAQPLDFEMVRRQCEFAVEQRHVMQMFAELRTAADGRNAIHSAPGR
jgi:peptidyl-prolyl cis-trans isomerase C